MINYIYEPNLSRKKHIHDMPRAAKHRTTWRCECGKALWAIRDYKEYIGDGRCIAQLRWYHFIEYWIIRKDI